MKKELTIKIMKELLGELKLNPNEMASILGMKRTQGLYDILNPEKKVGISKKMADNICDKFPNINKSYLLAGEGKILKTPSEPVVVQQTESEAMLLLLGMLKEERDKCEKLLVENALLKEEIKNTKKIINDMGQYGNNGKRPTISHKKLPETLQDLSVHS
jgi:hypothetical protein